MGLFSKIKQGLDKTRKNIMSGVDGVLKSFVKIDDEMFDELEEALILSDIGARTSAEIIEKVKDKVKSEGVSDPADIKNILTEEIAEMLTQDEDEAAFELSSPSVVLVIGVNGVGKTTSIGKLASIFKSEGKKVMLAAADTFRAAAIDQLEIWAERSDVPMIKHQENSDPAAVIFDAVSSAKARKTDVLICDTAGRLQNKKNLMEELRKIAKVIAREWPEAHCETLLVLDAVTGQNAISQAREFKEIADITGIILTKLDGTARGGIIIPIKNELNLPVRFVGVGEQVDDLQSFDALQFAKAIFED